MSSISGKRDVGRIKDLSGKRFGKLVVEKIDTKNPSQVVYYICRCDCGKKTRVRSAHLLTGNSRSCGCLRVEVHTTHGMSKSSEYFSWWNMIRMSRRVKICKRWSSFENFIVDMGRKPSKDYTIKRRNESGDYSKSNCFWSKKKNIKLTGDHSAR